MIHEPELDAALPIRVLLIDDHPLFRSGMSHALDAAPDIQVVGQAGTVATGLDAAAELRPDVVVMDLHLPDGSGIEATRWLLEAGTAFSAASEDVPDDASEAVCVRGGEESRPAVLVMTMSEETDTVFAAMRAGARGYLLKDAGRDQVVTAVRIVAEGGAIIGPRLAGQLAAFVASSAGEPSAGGSAAAPDTRPLPPLTERELEVLSLLAGGHSNGRIALELRLKEKTVRNHVSNIFAKLEVADRTAAALRARDAGIGRPGLTRV